MTDTFSERRRLSKCMKALLSRDTFSVAARSKVVLLSLQLPPVTLRSDVLSSRYKSVMSVVTQQRAVEVI